MIALPKIKALIVLLLLTGFTVNAAGQGLVEQIQQDLKEQIKWLRYDVGVYFMEDDKVNVHKIDQATSVKLHVREEMFIAERLAMQGKNQQAIEHIDKAIKLDPSNMQLAVRKLPLLIGLMRRDEALSLAEKIRTEAPELAETYLHLGTLLQERRRSEEAKEAYHQGLIHQPNNLLLLQALGQLEIDVQNWDEAIEAFDRIVKFDERQIGAFYLLGNLYLIKANAPVREGPALTEEERRELLDKAARHLELAIKLRSEFPEFYVRLGLVYSLMGEAEKVLDVYKRALSTDPGNRDFQRMFEQAANQQPGGPLEAYMALAAANPQKTELMRLAVERAMSFGRRPMAIKLLTELLEDEPTELQNYLLLAPLLIEDRQLDQALQVCQTALLIDETNIQLNLMAGECHYWQGDYEQAVVNYTSSLNSLEMSQDAYFKLVHSYEKLGQSEEALKTLKAADERFGQGTSQQLMLGSFYSQVGEPARAQAAFEKALEINPLEKRAYNFLARAYIDQGDQAKLDQLAQQGHESAFRDRPTDMDRILGDAYLADRQYNIAADYYERALAADVKEPEVYLGLFKAYNLSEEQQKREEIMMRAEKEIANIAVQRQLIAQMHYDLKNFAQAEKEARDALIAIPMISIMRSGVQQLNLRRILILSLAEQKKAEEAEKQIQLLLRDFAEVNGREALWIQCMALSTLRDYDAAIEAAQRLREQYGAQPELDLFLGSLWYEKQDLSRAEEQFRKAIAANPYYADAYNYLGYMFAEKGIRLDEAQQLVEQALSLKPKEGYIIDSMGWIHYQRGEYEKAVEVLEQAVKRSDPDSDILEHLGDAYAKVKNKEKAILYWRKALDLGPEKQTVRQKIEEAKKR